MSRHVNHRGWIAHQSIESDDRSTCVDFFEDVDGRFGFELFRSDPEDMGRWTSLSRYSSIPWLSDQPRVAKIFRDWTKDIAGEERSR